MSDALSLKVNFKDSPNTKRGSWTVVGYSKTGTKTINAALTLLGYEVYDFIDHFWYHEKEWTKIIKEGGTVEDFKRMYENVDAAVDSPVYFFWEEIAEAFPDAKIILTTRDEDGWAESLCKQLKAITSNSWFWSNLSPPVSRRFYNFIELYVPFCLGGVFPTGNQEKKANPLLLKKLFRRHNTYILQKAPKDRLLVYNVKEGWKPLCEFLGKKIPNSPFPWKNKGGSEELKEMVQKHPYGKQYIKETKIIGGLLFAFIGILLYLVYKMLLSFM